MLNRVRDWLFGLGVMMAPDTPSGEPDMDNFEDEASDEVEIVVLPEGEEPPKEGGGEESEDSPVQLTKAEFEALKKSGDSASAMKEAIGSLADVLNRRGEGGGKQESGETDEQFNERITKDLWDEKKAPEALRSMVYRVAGPAFREMVNEIIERDREILEIRPSTQKLYAKYKDEVDKEFEGMGAQDKLSPKAYRTAFERVKVRHQGEIQSESFSEQFDKRLEELGGKIDPKTGKLVLSDEEEGGGVSKPRSHSEGGGVNRGGRKVFITAKEASDRKRKAVEAEELGLDVERM